MRRPGDGLVFSHSSERDQVDRDIGCSLRSLEQEPMFDQGWSKFARREQS
jgi:hypothetical protein